MTNPQPPDRATVWSCSEAQAYLKLDGSVIPVGRMRWIAARSQPIGSAECRRGEISHREPRIHVVEEIPRCDRERHVVTLVTLVRVENAGVVVLVDRGQGFGIASFLGVPGLASRPASAAAKSESLVHTEIQCDKRGPLPIAARNQRCPKRRVGIEPSERRNQRAGGIRADSQRGPFGKQAVVVCVSSSRNVEGRPGPSHHERAEHIASRTRERPSPHKTMPYIGRGAAIFLPQIELIRRERARTIRVRENPAVGIITIHAKPAAEGPAHVGNDLIPVEDPGRLVLIEVWTGATLGR